MIGAQIDNYRITEKLGDGGMGSVYKAVDVMLEREVALKFLRPELAQQPDLVERFRAEAVVLAKLSHQNIASLYGLHRHGTDFFMAMEYVPGSTLEVLLKKEGKLPVAHATALTGQVLDALEYAHRRGVVHRDIKSANVIVMPGGGVKVMDFGIARVLGTERRTRVGFVVGTIGYMAPEQIQGLEVDGRTDIYALGVMLYEMLTGRMPFVGDTEYSVMQAQIQQMPVPPRVFADVPVPVENTIMRSLAKLPHERFQTAAEFHAALAESLRLSAAYPAMTPPIASASDETREFKSDPHLVAATVPPSGVTPSYPLPPSGSYPAPSTGSSAGAVSYSGPGVAPPSPPTVPSSPPSGQVPISPDSAPTALFTETPGIGYPVPPTGSGAWSQQPATATPVPGERPQEPPPIAAMAPPTSATGAAPAPVAEAVPPAAVTAVSRPPTSPATVVETPVRPATGAAVAKAPGPAPRKGVNAGLVVLVVGLFLLIALAGAGFYAWQQWGQRAVPPESVAELPPEPPPVEPGTLAPAIEPSVPGVTPAAPPPPSLPPSQKVPAKPATKVEPPRPSETVAPASVEPVPSPVPPTVVTPELVAPQEAPRPAQPPAMFGNTKWMQVEGTRVRETDTFLQITDSELRLLDARGRATVARLPFGSVSEVHYSSGKRPAWRKDFGPVPIESAFDSTLRTFHYLAFQGPAQFLLLRVDRDDLPRLRDELKKRAGLLIE